MALSEAYADSFTVTTTEYSITNESTTIASRTDDGLYQVFLDLNALQSGDTYVIRIYEKVQSGTTQRVVQSWTVSGVQADPIWASPHLQLMHGWDITLQKTGGTNRTIDWSVRKVA